MPYFQRRVDRGEQPGRDVRGLPEKPMNYLGTDTLATLDSVNSN